MNKEEVKTKLVEPLKDVLNDMSKNQKNPFIVKYSVKGKHHGYHRSTLCSITHNPLDAKRYTGDPIKQIEVISRNLESVLNTPNKDKNSLSYKFTNLIYEYDWKGVDIKDVFIDFEYLGKVEPQTFTVKQIN